MTDKINMNRRQFVLTTAVVGGGLAVGLAPRSAAAAFVQAQPWDQPEPAGSIEFSAWVSIAPDDTITIRVPTPEIGNGVLTQVPATVCEELECDWSKVRAEYASPTRDFVEGGPYSKGVGTLAFFGGRSTAKSRQQMLLQIGAGTRELLKLAAAQQWNVPVAEVEAKDSKITHRASGRSLRYGELSPKAVALKLDKDPALKDPKQWARLGKENFLRINIPMMTRGEAVFGMDVQLPNKLYAALRLSPAQGGKLKSYNFDAVKGREGVRGVVVVDPSEPRADLKAPAVNPAPASAPQSGIAVIADHYWQARSALDSMPMEWDDGPGAKWTTTETIYKAVLDGLNEPGAVVRKEGDVAAALAAPGARKVEGTYLMPYADHATMEPLNGTAMVTPDKVEVWMPTQLPDRAHMVAAHETGVDPAKVFVYATFVGGGFGRRTSQDDTRMVVAIAKKMPGRPIHVIWSREESIRQGRYRPLQSGRLTAVLGADGMPTAMLVRLAGHAYPANFATMQSLGPTGGLPTNGIGNAPYAGMIPNFQVEAKPVLSNLLGGPWRGPSTLGTTFFLESFIDECALAAGKDPIEYRRALLKNEKNPAWLASLNEAAKQSGWGKTLPKGTAQGFAVGYFGETMVANVMTLQVGQDGGVKVLQTDVGFDTGNVLNRDVVMNQIEGAQVMGINMAMNEELTVRNGRVVEGNFDDYPMIRVADTPKINVHFGGLTGGDRYSEIGEPPIIPVAPAMANAIARATGKRVRSLPFRNADLSWS